MKWGELLDYTPAEFGLLRDAYIDSLEVDDQRLSVLMALVANACAGRKKGQPPWTPEDFRIDRRGEKPKAAEPQSMEAQKGVLEAMTKMMGGRIGKPKPKPDVVKGS